MADPVNDVLAGMVSATRASTQVRSDAAPDPQQRMLSIFEAAFPDQEFETVVEDGVSRGVRGRPKASSAVPQASIPEGYSPQRNMVAIQEMQSALEKATTDADKYKIATNLNILVNTQKAYNFGVYKQQSEAEFGVPDLVMAVERTKQAELASPYNPGTGMPSQQRLELLQALGVARGRAAVRVGELQANDPTLAAAENLAVGTIKGVQGSVGLAQKEAILDEKARVKMARDAAISSFDPSFLDNVGIMKRGKIVTDPTERAALAGDIYDNKIRLTETETLLANAKSDTLQNYYLSTKDPKDKNLVLTILQNKELQVTGDPAQAERNIKLFKAVFDMDLGSDDARIPKQIKDDWKKANTEALAQAAGSGQSKDALLLNKRVALQRQFLASLVKEQVLGDVKGWQGLITADNAARGVLIAHGGKEPLPVGKFITAYMDANKQQDPKKTVNALRGIIVSAYEGLPRSNVLPIPAPDSALLEADRLIAAQTINQFRLTGIPLLDLVKTTVARATQ